MEYAIVDKNGKFIGKTTNELISKIPMPNTFRSDETAIWHNKKWEIKIEEPAKLVISQDGKLDYSPAVAKKFLDLVNKSRNPEKPYDRIFDNSIFSKMKDPKVIHELKTKNCLINDKKYELKISKFNQVKNKFCNAIIYENCQICLNNFYDDDEISLFTCQKHIFHFKCLNEWIQYKPVCPICREIYSEK